MAEPQRIHTSLASLLTLVGVLVLGAGLLVAASCLHGPRTTSADRGDWVADVKTAPLRHTPQRPWQEPQLDEAERRYWPMVRRLSEREGIDPALVMAVVHVESRFDPDAQSQKGARGLMQLSPVTAEGLGLTNPHDPAANLKAGIRYLSSLKKTFDDDLVLTLAAYNAGPTKVQQAGRVVPDIEQTRDFISNVLAQADDYRSRIPGLPHP